MGKEKYIRDVENLFKKSPVVDASSIERIIKSKKQVKQYNKQLIRNLVLGGKIKRLTKGYYTTHEDPSLIVSCFSPAYLGLYDALSFHNLWEQETIPVIISTRKVRPGIRKVFDTNVLIKRIKKKYFFGIDYHKQHDFYLPYSDIEKTFIDMVYFKEKPNKEVIIEIRKRIDKGRLEHYLKFYPERFKETVLKLIC